MSRRRLVVIPSDPLDAYVAMGWGDNLRDYFNPQGFFDEVAVVSPLERGRRSEFGMTIAGSDARSFRATLREFSPDVVRAYGGYGASDLACRHRLPGVPVIVSVHDPNPALFHASVRHADLVVCTCEAVRELALSKGVDASRIRILPNRVDLAIFRPVSEFETVAKRLPDALRGRKGILHVGRRSPEKNLDTTIAALRHLDDDYVAVFIGAGDAEPYQQLAEQHGVAERCAWVDAVPNAELPAWYCWAACMCTPSRWEGFGIVFIEAAACGARIVTSDVPPMNDYLRDGESARLVERFEDPLALADAIREVCETGDRGEQIRAGARRVASRFEKSRVDALELRIYQEALTLDPAPPGRRLAQQVWSLNESLHSNFAIAAAGRRLRALGKRLTQQWPARQRTSTAARKSGPARALDWVRNCELQTGGIAVHADASDAYPEVTGYLIPTLLAHGERALALRLTRWLLCIQRADGGFDSPDGVPHVFDTGQVLRGLLSTADLVPGAADAAQRAAAYLCNQAVDGGERGFGERYGGEIPESVHLYALPPLLEAAKRFDTPHYRDTALQCADFYAAARDCVEPTQLTHFLAYALDALIDLGRPELAAPVLHQLSERQREDGAVAGAGDVPWVCAPGLAQLAICWYKLGHHQPADAALGWLERHQRESGGFLGSSGPGASYFPDEELAWAAKYYLDAHQLRVQSFFARHAGAFPSDVAADDGRAEAILACVEPGDRVLEVGCGKGRFLKSLSASLDSVECVGVDPSPELLSEVPETIATSEGWLESIPHADAQFDVVYSVEAIEHSTNPAAAVAEMIRVARPGGWILVIDKQGSHWGRLETPSWERWPEASWLRELLRLGCDEVSADPVGYDGRDPSDGLMMAWRGRKRSRLSGADWHDALLSGSNQAALVERIRRNQLTEWGQEILLATQPGQQVLEIGSGTGEISLFLARAGRRVTVIDYSAESLAFVRRCSRDLGVELETVLADATRALPFGSDRFDCTWSSGLLEHFESAERREMLRHWARVTRGVLIDLVPNGACVGYRAGKAELEASGAWIYGLEMPLLTQRDDFEAAGLRVQSEFSVGGKHALDFLSADHPLRCALAAWVDDKSPEELRELGQGYLLVTTGRKRDASD